MLQRIQTIWILLSVLAAAFLYITGQDVEVFGKTPIISISSIVLVLVGAFIYLALKTEKDRSC